MCYCEMSVWSETVHARVKIPASLQVDKPLLPARVWDVALYLLTFSGCFSHSHY